MENYNTNTEYHKYTGSFQVLPKKNHPHLKCQFPPKTPILPKSLLYKHSEKWLSPSPPLPPHHPRGECELSNYAK